MLKVFLAGICMMFVLSETTLAQNKASSRSRPRKTAPSAYPVYNPAPVEPVVAPPSAKHFYVTALYSSANAIKYKGSAPLLGTPTDFTATESTTGALGFAGGYISKEAERFGYSGELAYELPRTSSGIEGMLGNHGVHGTYDGNPSNSVLTVAVNGNYSLSARIYFFAGINYPFTSGNGDSLNGLFGYQAGAGLSVSPQWEAELSYRTLRLKGNIESPGFNIQVDEASFSGMILAVHYLF